MVDVQDISCPLQKERAVQGLKYTLLIGIKSITALLNSIVRFKAYIYPPERLRASLITSMPPFVPAKRRS